MALDNANEFLVIAEFCQHRNLFAKGATHLVFALEELSKAAVLQLKALNPQIRITNLYDYFHKHNVKHVSIVQLVSVLKGSDVDAAGTAADLPSERAVGITLIAFIALLFIGYLLIKKADSDSTTVSKKSYPARQPDVSRDHAANWFVRGVQ